MYAETEPGAAAERTAFRRAEKQYKLYKPPSRKGRSRSLSLGPPTSLAGGNSRADSRLFNRCRGKQSGGGGGGVGGGGGGGDLSAVVDFHALLAAGEGELPAGIRRCHRAGFHLPVFCFLDRPGFYFIPGALSTEEQCYWIRESLKTFPQPPNRTNLTAAYGPISDLLVAAKNQKILVEVESSNGQERDEQSNVGENAYPGKFKFVDGSEVQKEERPKSTTAAALVRKLRWSTLGLQFDWSKVCDMLGGHVDDMEADWTKPIVSISLGCKCIFLLGGKTRDEAPTPMFLRSGDIVLMAGEARERFHGVPRIFTESDQQGISALVSELSGDDDRFILDYIHNSRININIRQVY
ncbi:alpha-ketoglutarate-dependent dioxygenase alkB isoform X3 [Hordeum vulgare subsp. vulgare]|uniref:alpha-ketoglutarate-dependent dioxygenase alkB isoform X3 n=1 Tax=Hordeum vulgare subsp. vulgare TaxID=112509 RepID=UPI001D1A3B35|nr:alpha-ketoglutarate-dependent dioxygenase alkB isoform X3 [Hordeum vulgare subsp. vulgare]